jgi:paraquat-inducible protein A
VLEKGGRLGPDTALVFSVTGLTLSVPALLLPFVSASTLGNERISFLFTGVESLWSGGMPSLSVLVFVCGWLLPFALLSAFAILRAPARLGWQKSDLHPLSRAARVLERWAIPEVQVLAVLVGLMKLGDVVDITIGPGFWCYCAMAFSLLIARHSFDLDSTAALHDAGERDAAARP